MKKDDELKFIRLAVKRLDAAIEFESVNRNAALDDLRFVNGDQWPESIRSQREREGRPCQTINKLAVFARQVTNDARQARPSIKVHPVDNMADPDTADVLSGLIRHIEYDSHAEDAYDTALESAVRCGFGFWRVLTEYEYNDSFNQCIKIKRIRNPFMVYLDPASQELDGSDAEYGFIIDDIKKDEFKSLYPNAAETNFDTNATGQSSNNWLNGETIRVAEYFYYENNVACLCLLDDGKTAYEDELPEGAIVVKKRSVSRKQLKWCKMTHAEILEKRDWPGKWIPIIPVYGDELDIEGEVTRSGIIRFAKDPQRMYNYWKTTETELVALAPKAPYIGAEGQFEGHEDKWEQANSRSFPYLEYKEKTSMGTMAGAPQRQPFAGAPAGVITAALSAADDIKATTGIFDASLGNRGNETSGRAILARQQEGDTANFHYIDNQSKAIRQTGRIIIDLIPKYYDAPRIVRILGEDGNSEAVKVNSPMDEPEFNEETGAIKRVMNDLTIGRYDVTVSVGPSYSTKRQEAAEAMSQLIQAQPQLMQIFGDLAIKAMDWPGADEIAERIKKTIPSEIQGNQDNQQQQQQLPPEIMQKMQQMQQYIQQLEQQAQGSMLDMQKEQLRSQTQIEVARINAESRTDIEELKGTVQMLLAKMPPPPALAAATMNDLNEEDKRNSVAFGNENDYIDGNSIPESSQFNESPMNTTDLPVSQQGDNFME